MRGAGGAMCALLACVCVLHTSAADAQSHEISRDLSERGAPVRVVLDALSEPQLRSALGDSSFSVTGFSEQGALALFALRPAREPLTGQSRRFSLEYMLQAPAARLTLRAGYRYGLPFDEVEHGNDAVVLSAGGTLSISAGTVAWLQVDLQGFRELAGARLLRLDAVPGIRIRPTGWPVEVGAGVLVSFAPGEGASSFDQRLTKVLQLGSTF